MMNLTSIGVRAGDMVTIHSDMKTTYSSYYGKVLDVTPEHVTIADEEYESGDLIVVSASHVVAVVKHIQK